MGVAVAKSERCVAAARAADAGEMGEADRLTIAGGMPGIVLMENAGRARRRRGVAALAAAAGGGAVRARATMAATALSRRALLAERGWPVRRGAARRPRGAARRCRVAAAARGRARSSRWRRRRSTAPGLSSTRIFGAGLARPVEGVAREVIEALDPTRLPVVAVDVPSGVDGASGEVRGHRAARGADRDLFPPQARASAAAGAGAIAARPCSRRSASPPPCSTRSRRMPRPIDPDWWLGAFPWPGPESHKYTPRACAGRRRRGDDRRGAAGGARRRAGSAPGWSRSPRPKPAFPIYAAALTGVIVQPGCGDRRRSASCSPTRGATRR